MAGSDDAPELFGIDVQQVSRRVVLVAKHGLYGLQIAEPGQVGPCQNSADGGCRDTCVANNAGLQHPAFAQLHNEQGLGLVDGFWRPCRPGRRIGQGGFAATQIPAKPLPGGLRSDAISLARLSRIEALHGHLFDHLDSTDEGESGMLMTVHLVGCPERIGCLATSSLSNPIRMNTGYNLLKLHS